MRVARRIIKNATRRLHEATRCYTRLHGGYTRLHEATRGYTAAYTRRHEAPLRATSLRRIFPQRSAEIRRDPQTSPKKLKQKRTAKRTQNQANPDGRSAETRRDPQRPAEIRRLPRCDFPLDSARKPYTPNPKIAAHLCLGFGLGVRLGSAWLGSARARSAGLARLGWLGLRGLTRGSRFGRGILRIFWV